MITSYLFLGEVDWVDVSFDEKCAQAEKRIIRKNWSKFL